MKSMQLLHRKDDGNHMKKVPLKADIIRVKRASVHKFAERLSFRFWRLKQKIALKIWLIYIKHFDANSGFGEDDSSLDDAETQAIFEALDRDEQKYVIYRSKTPNRTKTDRINLYTYLYHSIL